jgi:predicted dehydrogenase
MGKVRIGLIGMGMIGKLHAETMAKMSELEFVAASDVEAKHEKIARDLGTKFYQSYEDMIAKEKMDGVLIAVPNELHLAVGAKCAEKKLHLLVEKPIASNLSDADRLVEAAKKNGVHLLIAHHRRHNPFVEALREHVRGGGLGRLVGVSVLWSLYKPTDYFKGPFSWRAQKGGGPILINLIHEIDTLRYVCGDIKRLYAEVSNSARKFPVEDTVSINVRLENDALATIFLTDTSPGNIGYESNTGENLFFYHNQKPCYYYFGTEGSMIFPQLRKSYYPEPAKAGWQFPLFETGIKVDREDPYTRQLRHFCRLIEGKEASKCSGEDARKTLEVTLAINKSGETGQAIVF